MIVFDGDEGRLSETALLKDLAGHLPADKARVLFAVQQASHSRDDPSWDYDECWLNALERVMREQGMSRLSPTALIS